MSPNTNITIPKKLPLLIVYNGVLLPGSTIRIPVTTVKSINLVRSRLMSGSQLTSTVIGVVTKEPDNEKSLKNLHEIGTAGVVVQVTGTNWPRPSYTLLVTGLCRFRLDSIIQEHPYPVGAVTQLDDIKEISSEGDDTQLAELITEFKEAARKLIELLDVSVPAVAKLKELVDRVPSRHLADVVAALVKATLPERLQVLDAVDIATRIRVTLPLLLRHIQRLKDVREAAGDETGNKENQIVKISRGGRNLSPDPEFEDDGEDGIAEFETKIKEANMPDDARKAALKELGRLKRMAPHMPEYSMTRNYLELMVDLPWSATVRETCNIGKARADMDADHYGMEKVKRRVLEYLAVRQLRGDLKGPILCFVGPPGVGKTSIAKSIATTLGRPYQRISLGGISDQHDIRGHRRTYIGAMPGRVIQALRNVKAKNPVLLLDEVDKLGSGIHGDPGAALLEVLDPEQNFAFTDTYLGLPFDLSQVLFVATANTLSSIPTPLMDRMEVIHVPGYTQEEKIMIGQLHLLPKQLREHGLTSDIMHVPPESIATVIGEYTREAGVRTLERKIGALCRAVAVQVAEAKPEDQAAIGEEGVKADMVVAEAEEKGDNTQQEELHKEGSQAAGDHADHHPPLINLTHLKEYLDLPVQVDAKMIHDVLGPPIFQSGLSGRVSVPGVAVGLAWTPVGGEVMVVEASRTGGDGGLTLTGQLGSVMQESAKIAMSWVRQHSFLIGLEKDFMKDGEIHMHFPAGAISKDGPSAGVTILTVLVSLLSQRCVRPDVAMTGEITLNGVVLPVGGIKEKVMAAHRAGLTTLVLPAANKKDLADISNSVLNEVEVVLVNTVEEVLQAAFEDGFSEVFDEDKDGESVSKSPMSKL
ncbi:lon protease homolog 2, peroxisomal-like isoform X1 [Penaeus japonicus]|uniref:lon protease homolog 2, peroxisomal-like isoform X1 n=1 Tax=Penaeus japonicus TaxID=27405 RepID=UPI001C710675|nr:lon protease homolog 2, peroxisomal-like isoform X1 [Penaeus japonicus]